MAEHRGGSGNFAEDKEKASEAGRKAASIAVGTLKTTHSVHLKRVKGGQNSHSGGRKSGN